MTRNLVVVLSVVALGCGGHKPGDGKATGDLYDSNPQLAFIPADTAYAMVSFKTVPLALSRRWSAIADTIPVDPKEAAQPGPLRVWNEVLGRDHSPEHQAAVGLSETPRIAAYAVDGFPVVRMEIADGKRLAPALQAAADRIGYALPAPITDGDWWTLTASFGRFDVLFGIAKRELVVAIAPAAVLHARHDLILGIAHPDTAIAPSVFREVAERSGFTGLAVGFVDLRRVIHAFAAPTMIGGACGTAIDDVAGAVPRIVFGYNADDQGFDVRTVFELSPPVLAAIGALASEIPHGERSGEPALMTLAAAIDLDRAFDLAPAVAAAADHLAAACGLRDPGLRRDADKLAQRPAFLRGITGGAAVITAYDPATEQVDGSMVVHTADARALLDGIAGQIGGIKLGLVPDGHAIQLLPNLIDPPIFAAMSAKSIAMARGPGAIDEAEAALGGDPQPAPLLHVRADFREFGKFMPATAFLGKIFGEATFTLEIGATGLVLGARFETVFTNQRAN